MAAALHGAWRARGPLACLLWPASLAYGALAAVHRALFRTGVLRVDRVNVPVVVVGNVVAGGAGKTPVVLAIVEHLRQQGVAAGVVSRGYGRRTTGVAEVLATSPPADTGDEPLLIRQRSGAPVFVGEHRAAAARALLAAHPQVRVIVSDDGLQHHGLARDVEVCVFDERGTGNGWLLPAGPLRERWPRPVDLVLRHGDPAGIGGHPMERRLAPDAIRADGARMPLARLAGVPVHAVAGIAQPRRFFDALRDAGLQVAGEHPFPDHHDFADAARAFQGDWTLVCTEKDAVKLWRVRPDAWAVPLQVRIPAAFWQALDRALHARLSSPDGPPPP